VDSLKKLNILDDIMISADERHYFKGLARRRGTHICCIYLDYPVIKVMPLLMLITYTNEVHLLKD